MATTFFQTYMENFSGKFNKQVFGNLDRTEKMCHEFPVLYT